MQCPQFYAREERNIAFTIARMASISRRKKMASIIVLTVVVVAFVYLFTPSESQVHVNPNHTEKGEGEDQVHINPNSVDTREGVNQIHLNRDNMDKGEKSNRTHVNRDKIQRGEKALTVNSSGKLPAPQMMNAGTGLRQEVHHLFFLKVHKAASTTVFNIIYRFALNRSLVVLLPIPKLANVLHEKSKNWFPNALPLPHGATHFDILCNHLIFEEDSIHKVLPQNAVFVAIVRQPWEQFVSAFWYYQRQYPTYYLKKIRGKWPLSVYLEKPQKWEPNDSYKSFTHNRMSVDFGMDKNKMGDPSYVESYIGYLNSTFQLVMVSDRFDESLLLLRRLLGWRVQDVLYLNSNVHKDSRPGQNFTLRERQTHREFNLADYLLYEHFSRVLDDRVRAAGEAFQAEVRAFRAVLTSVRNQCLGTGHRGKAARIVAHYWREEFWLTSQTCDLMMMRELDLVKRMRKARLTMGKQTDTGL